MSYRKAFRVAPGEAPRLDRRDPAFAERHDRAEALTRAAVAEIARQQDLLYAGQGGAVLVVLQGLDAAGKDGVIRHLFTGLNPQGTRVHAFRQPSALEAAHDVLWRVHAAAPARGEVAIFNRSHYEDVLVPRVHRQIGRQAWARRCDAINGFEATLAAAGTRILKFFLHISPAEQLERFRQRLLDPARQWKISESDYTERELWPRYIAAYEEAIARTSSAAAPWFVIPADHKWFRNLAISRIVAAEMGRMKLTCPPPRVDIEDIRRRFHAAEVDGST